NWVVGIQGDFAGTRLTALERLTADLFGNNDSTTGFYHVRTEWLASITGRLGFTGWLGPPTLIYIRGGAAWGCDKWQIDSEGAHSQFRVDFDQTRSGWTIGGGLEYAITDRWRVFGEYNHYDFGDKVLGSASGTGSGTTTFTNTKQRIEAVRLGVNY